MDTPIPAPAPGPGMAPRARTRRPVLAVLSLALGVLGLVLSVVVVGALFAVFGLLLGTIHLWRNREGRAVAWTGMGLSALALVTSAGVLAWFVTALHQGPRHIGRMEGGPRPIDPQTWEGQALPDFEVISLEGEPLRSTDWRGRRVVLAVGATWCAPCVQEVPLLRRLVDEAGTNRVVVVGLSAEDRTVLKAFAREHGITYPMASAAPEQLPGLLGQIEGFPTTVFLDADGRVADVVSGPMEYEQLKAKALGERVEGAPGR